MKLGSTRWKVIWLLTLISVVRSMDAVPAKLDDIAAHYADGRQYTLDGLSVEYDTWHFNVRPSNTEPLLRLNLEATTSALMTQKRDEVVALIRS